MLRRFNEDKPKPSSTLMIVHSLDPKKDKFRLADDNEEIWEPEVSYMSTINPLLYLSQYTRLNISFIINLLARYSSEHAATKFA